MRRKWLYVHYQLLVPNHVTYFHENIDSTKAPRLILNNRSLPYSDKLKNLGLNKNLGWIDYVNETCNRVFAGIHTLKCFSFIYP